VGERGDAAGHLGDLARLQRAELDLGDFESASSEVDHQRVGVGPRGPVAAGQHEQHRQVRQSPTDVGAQSEARPVRAVGVLGDEQHGTPSRPLHQPQHRVEEPQPFQLGRRYGRGPCVDTERHGQYGRQPPQLHGPGCRGGRRRHHRHE
jgi:hypothetical protein